MSNVIELAVRGQRKAMEALYEANKQKVYYMSMLLLGRDAGAAKATCFVFKRVWSSMPETGMKSEEEFSSLVNQKMVEYCKTEMTKQNQKAFRIPQNRNFLVAAKKGFIDGAENTPAEILAMLPPLQRFIFVLHNVAVFFPEQIAETFKFDMKTVGLALEAEKTNIERTLSPFCECARDFDDFVQFVRGCEREIVVPEWVDKDIDKAIDNIAAPIEEMEKKREKRRITIFCISAIASLFLFIGVGSLIAFVNNDADSEGGATLISEPVIDLDETLTYYADIEIKGFGTVTVKLDQESTPVTVSNFVNLAQNGFYDGLTFHRIIEGFMMQGGCPNGDGYGKNKDEDGYAINIVGEFTSNGYENDLSHTRGAISMARSEAYNSASSQFFIVHEDSISLDGDYAVFGYVTEGMDVVDAVCEAAEPTDGNGTISADDQPVITSVTIRTEENADSSDDGEITTDTAGTDASAA